VGVKPRELACKASTQQAASFKMNKFLDKGGEYYGYIVDIEEIQGQKNIERHDAVLSLTIKNNKNSMINRKCNTLIIRGIKC
jgi:hypothetical protein